jgi:hypothetical protein
MSYTRRIGDRFYLCRDCGHVMAGCVVDTNRGMCGECGSTEVFPTKDEECVSR